MQLPYKSLDDVETWKKTFSNLYSKIVWSLTQIQWWIWEKQIFLVKIQRFVHRYYSIKLEFFLFSTPNILTCSFCLHILLCSWATHIYTNSTNFSFSHIPPTTHTTLHTPNKQNNLKLQRAFHLTPPLSWFPLANENLWKSFFLIKGLFSLDEPMGFDDEHAFQWCLGWESLYPMEH
jgi:hypothetical protein